MFRFRFLRPLSSLFVAWFALLLWIPAQALDRPDSPPLVERFTLPEPGNELGEIYDLQIDAGTMAVGYSHGVEFHGEKGRVVVLTHSQQGWTEQARIQPPPACRHCANFGERLALAGDTLLVSAKSDGDTSGVIYAYQRTGSEWTLNARWQPSSQIHALVGTAVATSGEYALIGAPNVDIGFFPFWQIARGAVYVYRYQDGAWQSEGQLSPDIPGQVQSFGNLIAMTKDTAVVGSEHATFVYRLRNGRWRQEAVLDQQNALETRDGVAVLGNRILSAQSYNNPRVMVYDRSNEGWALSATLTKPHPATDAPANGRYDGYGRRSRLNERFITAASSAADHQGMVHLFHLLPDGAVQQWSILPPPDSKTLYFGTQFGWVGNLLVAIDAKGQGFVYDCANLAGPPQPASPPRHSSPD